MNSNPQIFNGATVQLQHLKTNSYLYSNGAKLTSGSKATFLGGTSSYLEQGSFFTIHLHSIPPSKEPFPIHYGDLVYLQLNQMAVTLNLEHKSQTTGQKEAILLPLAMEIMPNQLFQVVPPENETKEPTTYSGKALMHEMIFRLVNIATNFSLHSHAHNYKQKDLLDFKEVTAFLERDDNDDWMINLSETNFIKGLPQHCPREMLRVHQQDKVVLRSAFIGASLHSHEVQLKNKHQEVSGSKMWPRDTNDLWQVVLYTKGQNQRSSLVETYMTYGSHFCLLHLQTNRMLTHIGGSKVENGLEVTCVEQVMKEIKHDEWRILPVGQREAQEQVCCNQPFIIRHTPTNHFLTMVDAPSPSTKHQFRVLLTPKAVNSSIWIVEQRRTDYMD